MRSFKDNVDLLQKQVLVGRGVNPELYEVVSEPFGLNPDEVHFGLHSLRRYVQRVELHSMSPEEDARTEQQAFEIVRDEGERVAADYRRMLANSRPIRMRPNDLLYKLLYSTNKKNGLENPILYVSDGKFVNVIADEHGTKVIVSILFANKYPSHVLAQVENDLRIALAEYAARLRK